MGTRLLDGRCLVTGFVINRLVRFPSLGLSRCLVTSRSLERLVTFFGAASSFGHHPSLTKRLCLSLVEDRLLFGHVCSLYRWVTFIYVALGSHLVIFLSLKPCRCLVTFRSVSCLFTFLSFEPGRPMGPEAQNTTL